jgi:hypothetical protein
MKDCIIWLFGSIMFLFVLFKALLINCIIQWRTIIGYGLGAGILMGPFTASIFLILSNTVFSFFNHSLAGIELGCIAREKVL